MGTMASKITSLTIVYSTVYSGADGRVTGLCAWNSPVTGEFHAQMASNAENVSIQLFGDCGRRKHPFSTEIVDFEVQ